MAPADTNSEVEQPPAEQPSQDGSSGREAPHTSGEDEADRKRPVPTTTLEPSHETVSPINVSWQKGPRSPQDKEKVTRVLAACQDRDRAALADLATSQGGLIEDELRRTACMSSHFLFQHVQSSLLIHV